MLVFDSVITLTVEKPFNNMFIQYYDSCALWFLISLGLYSVRLSHNVWIFHSQWEITHTKSYLMVMRVVLLILINYVSFERQSTEVLKPKHTTLKPQGQETAESHICAVFWAVNRETCQVEQRRPGKAFIFCPALTRVGLGSPDCYKMILTEENYSIPCYYHYLGFRGHVHISALRS